jgi:hypothetical protein
MHDIRSDGIEGTGVANHDRGDCHEWRRGIHVQGSDNR